MDGKEEKGARDSTVVTEMRWRPVVILSLVLHVAVFSAIFFIPESHPARRSFDGMIYEVSLVEMPGGGGGAREPGGASEMAAPAPAKKEEQAQRVPEAPAPVKKAEPAKRVPEAPAKPVPAAPKTQEKPVIIAKKTLDKPATTQEKPKVAPSSLIDQAISRIERTVQSDEHLESALARLQTTTADPVQDPGPSPGGGSGGGGSGGGGSGLGRGLPGITAVQIYQMQVESLIKSNWHYPVATDSRRDREAVVVLTVKRDGAIISSRFEKKSQNVLFDESVLKAVERSNPLPPFPESLRRSHEEIVIRFNLGDLERS